MCALISGEPAVAIIKSTPMTEPAGSSEMTECFYQTTRHCNPQDNCSVWNMINSFLIVWHIRIFYLFQSILFTTFKYQYIEFYKLMHQLLKFIIKYSSMYNNNLYIHSFEFLMYDQAVGEDKRHTFAKIMVLITIKIQMRM
jgi:hypothetical protein